MAKTINDLSELKNLMRPQQKPAETPAKKSAEDAKKQPNNIVPKVDNGILHSYIRHIVENSDIYDMMKDTEADGKSFSAFAASVTDDLSKDLIEYFACCFFEGEYSQLDIFAIQCEDGKRKNPSAEASILGHTVSMTYEQEFMLLSELFSIALLIDKRMDDHPEEVQFYYSPNSNPNIKKPKPDENIPTSSGNAPVLRYQGSTTEYSFHNRGIKTNKGEAQKAKQKKAGTRPTPTQTEFPKVDLSNKVRTKPKAHQGIVSSPSMKRRSFSSHIATEGVWGRIASYGGTHGPLIRINAGHGR